MLKDISAKIGDIDYKDLYSFIINKYNNTKFLVHVF